MDSLADKTSHKIMMKALEQLPTGRGALDTAYDEAMQRIEDQKPGFRDLAKEALAWIGFGTHILGVTELRHGLAIELGEYEVDEGNLIDIKEVLSACAGLVIVERSMEGEALGSIWLVHYTTQEYIRGTDSRHFPDYRQRVVAKCLTYLQLDAITNEWSDVHSRLRKYPLLEIAASHSINHVRRGWTKISKI